MISDQIKHLKNIAHSLPEQPGVYRFYNADHDIIYIGKAKNLKKRVLSYFTKNQESPKTNILVRKIQNIDHIVVETEEDALLLENSLIKKHKPRYNILLKDDKTYPWICIKNEDFPRVFYTRKYVKDNSLYFGPFTSITVVRGIIQIIKQIFYLRTCKLNLSNENITKNKFKVCLEYHIGNCKAPCVSFYTQAEYNDQIQQIENILKGKFPDTLYYFKKQMAHFSENLDYEKAQKSKEKIEILYNFQAKSTIVTSIKHNIDVFSINDDENFAYVNYLKTVNGTIIQVQNFEIRKKIGETAQEILPYAILDIYENKNFGHENVNEILLPFLPEFMLPYKKITIPTFGDKLKLLELSEKNGKYYRLEKNKQRTLVDPQRHSNRILLQMKEDLRMPVTPAHIECFDNSNIQGTSAVASCVVFKNAKPAKREYRKFNIKTVEGPDDFASMSEIIFRRYSRMINEKQTLPDLIIIDGGKGQLSAALESLDRLSLRGKVSIIGIAKKLEEIYFPGDQIPLYLNKNSETLKVIQHARDEAHRFGISFHRDKRSKKMTETELSKIEGVGTKTIEKLLKKFKSISKISKLSIDDLKNEVSQKQALKIFEKFHYISTDSVKSEIK